MEIERNIRIFFARYGRLLLFIIGVIFLIITSIQTANRIVAEETNSKIQNLTKEEQKIKTKEKEKETSEKVGIKKFIEYCKNNQLEEAYEMLSEESKEKYTTLEEFKEIFIKNNFSTKVISYSVYSKNEYYLVNLQQDFLETGKKSAMVTINLKIYTSILGDKIEILN